MKPSLYSWLASSTLCAVYLGYVHMAATGRGPYPWLLRLFQQVSDHHLIPVLAFVTGLLAALLPLAAIAIPLRRRIVGPPDNPAMPRPEEGLAGHLARGAEMEKRSARHPERRAFYRFQGRIAVLIGTVLIALTAGIATVTGVVLPILGLIGLLGVLGGATQLLTGGPMRFRRRSSR